MKATIINRKTIAKGTIQVDFKVDKNITFIPGQYFFLILKNPPFTDGKGDERHFTIVNSPTDKGILTMATRLRDTGFKKSLNILDIGTEVEIENIIGDFVLPETDNKSLVFIAGGIGITPFISFLRYIKAKQLKYEITLIYANSDKESAAFLTELKKYEKENKNFKLVLIMTKDKKWKGESGRIDNDFLKKYISNLNDKIIYVSGPPLMVESVSEVLSNNIDIKKENIILEEFFGY